MVRTGENCKRRHSDSHEGPEKLSSPGSKACLRGSARRFRSRSPPRWPGDVSTAESGKLSSCYTEAVLFAISPFPWSVRSHPAAALPIPMGGGHACAQTVVLLGECTHHPPLLPRRPEWWAGQRPGATHPSHFHLQLGSTSPR